jgi:hypothetical protein
VLKCLSSTSTLIKLKS